MKIFFLSPSINLDLWVNYGIASLCGVARERGHAVDLFQPVAFGARRFREAFGREDYALCLVSSVTNQWPHALRYIRELRAISRVPVFVGGHHATCCPEILERHPELDGICVGEGDVALGDLLDRMARGQDVTDIPGMWMRRGGEIVRNEVGPLVDPDTLPLPDFSVFSRQAIRNRPSLMLSRGCPYSCTYCCNNHLRRLYAGKGSWVRKKSVARAIAEVGAFVDSYRPPELNFDDDTFVKDKRWLYAFLEEYRRRFDVPFNCNSRPETLDDETCRRLKEAGCRVLCVGIENGSEELRRVRLGRTMSNASIVEAFRLLRRHGITSYAFNMVGAPDETWQDYLETVRLNALVQADGSQMTTFYPYPASELHDYAREKGYLTTPGFRDGFVSRSLLRMPQFPRWRISLAALLFKFRVAVYARPVLAKAALLPVFLARRGAERTLDWIKRFRSRLA